MTRVHDDIINFIARGSSPEEVAKFVPSVRAKKRVAHLLERLKAGLLTSEETSELDQYVELEHIMRMAKARARQHFER